MGPGTTREHPGLRLPGPNGGCKAERERGRGKGGGTDKQTLKNKEKERETNSIMLWRKNIKVLVREN